MIVYLDQVNGELYKVHLLLCNVSSQKTRKYGSADGHLHSLPQITEKLLRNLIMPHYNTADKTQKSNASNSLAFIKRMVIWATSIVFGASKK
jgi:hypothetical protein